MSAKYKLIVDEIERDILDGKYNSIGKLPTEEEINLYLNVEEGED